MCSNCNNHLPCISAQLRRFARRQSASCCFASPGDSLMLRVSNGVEAPAGLNAPGMGAHVPTARSSGKRPRRIPLATFHRCAELGHSAVHFLSAARSLDCTNTAGTCQNLCCWRYPSESWMLYIGGTPIAPVVCVSGDRMRQGNNSTFRMPECHLRLGLCLPQSRRWYFILGWQCRLVVVGMPA
jgi:hypothetical protein